MKNKLLIVDDDSLVIDFLTETLRDENYQITSAHSAESALATLASERFNLMLTDIKMGGMDGITLLSKVKEKWPEMTVVMMTAFGSVDTAVLAMKLGAFDFIMKPMSPEVVKVRLQKAGEHLKLKREVRTLRSDVAKRYRNIIGSSRQMRDIFEKINTAAPSRATVLITGESGSGKELVARAVHRESDRADGPFVKLNCAALNQNLIESELFGHEKGAFTGAIQARTGRFELAHGGTLLLDEISEMPVETQAKLLRVLQEQEVEKVGSAQPVSVDVRIIASSNRNLSEAIAEGKFREDLYYRLNVIGIELPPLRERMEDLPALVDYFIQKYSEENNREIKQVDEGAYQLFMNYHWPGNVRELENVLQSAVVMCRGARITNTDFTLQPPKKTVEGMETLTFDEIPLRDVERHVILDRLRKFRGNKTDAARSLGVAARTIRNKLKEYNGDESADDSDIPEIDAQAESALNQN